MSRPSRPDPLTRRSRPPTHLRCPTCKGPTHWDENPQRPFCSLTCRLIDLGVWLDERYRIPTGADETEGESGPNVS